MGRLGLDVDLMLFGDPLATGAAQPAALSGGEQEGGPRAGADPPIVVGVAIARTGIPLHVWCWPGHIGDPCLGDDLRNDLQGWTPSRVVWTGGSRAEWTAQQRELRLVARHFVMAEAPRTGSATAMRAMSLPGRYRLVAGGVAIKNVRLDHDGWSERLLIRRDQELAACDQQIRGRTVDELEAAIAGSDAMTVGQRHDLAERLGSVPASRNFLRTTKTGLLRVDRAKVAADAALDGKLVLRTSDDAGVAVDVAHAYQQLIDAERGWAELRATLDLKTASTMWQLCGSIAAPTSRDVDSAGVRQAMGGPAETAAPATAHPPGGTPGVGGRAGHARTDPA